MGFKFDSEAFIREMEEINGVEDSFLDYEEYEEWYGECYEQITERGLRGGL